MGKFILKRKTFAGLASLGKLATTSVAAKGAMNPIASRALWGAGIGAVGNGVASALTGDGDEMGKNFLSGAVKGAAIGGTIGAASGAMKNFKGNKEAFKSGSMADKKAATGYKPTGEVNVDTQKKIQGSETIKNNFQTPEAQKAMDASRAKFGAPQGSASKALDLSEAQKFQMENGLGGGFFSDTSNITGQKLFSQKSTFTLKRKTWN